MSSARVPQAGDSGGSPSRISSGILLLVVVGRMRRVHSVELGPPWLYLGHMS